MHHKAVEDRIVCQCVFYACLSPGVWDRECQCRTLVGVSAGAAMFDNGFIEGCQAGPGRWQSYGNYTQARKFFPFQHFKPKK